MFYESINLRPHEMVAGLWEQALLRLNLARTRTSPPFVLTPCCLPSSLGDPSPHSSPHLAPLPSARALFQAPASYLQLLSLSCLTSNPTWPRQNSSPFPPYSFLSAFFLFFGGASILLAKDWNLTVSFASSFFSSNLLFMSPNYQVLPFLPVW